MAHASQEIGLRPAGTLGVGLGPLQLGFDPLAFGDVARCREDALQRTASVIEGGGVVGDYSLLAVAPSHRQLIVGEGFFSEHTPDPCLGALRVGEAVLERGADQLVAGRAGQRLRLFVDVGDNARGVGGDQGVDVGFDQRARIELLIAQALVRLLLLFLDQFSRGVVGADQQVANDRA